MEMEIEDDEEKEDDKIQKFLINRVL